MRWRSAASRVFAKTWGRTLASAYSLRPKPGAPVTWDEVAKGFRLEDFNLRSVPERVEKMGDLYEPVLEKRGRVRREKFL